MPISDQIVNVQADVHIPFRMCNLIGLSGLFVIFYLLCVTNSALCGDPSRKKGRVGCYLAKFSFMVYWIELSKRNQKMYTCWGFRDHLRCQIAFRRQAPS